MSEIRVENIIGENGVDAVQFTKGINSTGTLTSTNVSAASSVTAGTFHGNGAGITGVSGGVLLRKTFYTITRQSITQSSFPNDDTAPQITEGTEFFSQAYTPSTANCELFITCSAGIRERTNVADDVGMALFISDNTSALRAVTEYNTTSGVVHGANIIITHKMPSWGVPSKTFSLRAHKVNSINYAATGYATEKYGAATHASLFVIEEIAT